MKKGQQQDMVVCAGGGAEGPAPGYGPGGLRATAAAREGNVRASDGRGC